MTDKEKAIALMEKGMRTREIADTVGRSYNTVYGWLKGSRSGRKGFNADRHLCRSCQYGMSDYTRRGAGMNCNYIGITERKRPCKPESCTVYVKGKRLKDKGADEFNPRS